MPLLSADETRRRLDGVVHFDTQSEAADDGLDLTADAVFAFTGPGQLDFGGDEEQAAERRRLDPEKRDPDDDYGWWDLEEGTYPVRFNESIELGAGEIALLGPHERLLRAGAHHPVCWLRAPRETSEALEAVLAVGSAGLHVKENARLSTLLLFDEGGA
ncbi:MAG: deoxycytidine triphosphate deaminase [Bacteroidetes bacterium QS_8_68_15]|nr:MAG: deoxycytidine triphosphate deaminase [Bacteroidetes bacterium QS_8_68_15]